MITGMVKPSDKVMLKRLKNLRKIQERKQKMKEQKKLSDSNKAGSDDEEFNVKTRPKT